MDGVKIEHYLRALNQELRGMNSRLEVLNRKLDENKKCLDGLDQKVTSGNTEKQAEENKSKYEKDSRGRVKLTPEQFYNLRKQGYSLNDISSKTGWSRSTVQNMIYQVERQRGEK